MKMDRQLVIEEELRDQIYRVSREAQGRGKMQSEFDSFKREYQNRSQELNGMLNGVAKEDNATKAPILRELLNERDKADEWSKRMGEVILSHEKAVASALASARMAALLTNVEAD